MVSTETTGTAPSLRTRAIVDGVIVGSMTLGLVFGWGHPVLRGFMFGIMLMLLPGSWTEIGVLRKNVRAHARTGRHNA